jgi:hypothetical protein
MRKIRDVLRLRLAAGLSIRQIRASTKVSVGAIQKLLVQADALACRGHYLTHLHPQDRMPTRDSTSCVAGFWEIIEASM